MFKDKMFNETIWNLEDDAHKMWRTMVTTIKILKGILGDAKKKGPISKEISCSKDEVQAITRKI